jgi:DNA-binding winged helix-turn-helix (wHTH) protein/tetratricopeptide (TPR) repeat protein
MSRPTYRFGACTIDPSTRELRTGGALATLSPKVFDVLVYLVEHRDRAVGRDELIAAVWGKLDVTDTLLGQTVLKARRAVGDSGQNVIRTIPRFGYRWVADIDVETAADAPPSERAVVREEPAHPPDAPVQAQVRIAPPNPSRGIAIAAAATIVIALVAGGWFLRYGAPPRASPQTSGLTPSTTPTAAVLPVEVSASEEWSWLRLGLMDLIAARLRRAGQGVVPSDNVVALARAEHANADDSFVALRQATGARYVVVPRIERSANGWTVEMTLRGDDGSSYEARASGADPIETARLASDRLLASLGKTAPTDGTGELSLAELEQRTESAVLSDDFVTARRLIDAASEPLRKTPIMRLRLGQIEFRSGQLAAARTTLESLIADTAPESDPFVRGWALYQIGAVSLRQDRNDDAMRAFNQSIALTSTHNEPGVLGRAYTGLAAAQVNIGHFDEAADNLGRARVAVGLSGDNLQLARIDANEGVLDNARGRHAEALPILERAAQRFQQFGALNELFLTVAAEMKAHLGLLDASAALAASDPVWAMRTRLDNPGTRTAFELQRARALAACGRIADARKMLDDLKRDAQPGETGLPGDVASESARMHLAVGDAPAALDDAAAAVARLPTIDEARERARAWLTWSRALRAAGRTAEARSQVAEFARWAATHPAMPSVTLFAALADAEQAAAEDRRDDALKSYNTALGDAERWAVPADLATVAISYGNHLIASADFERASAIIGRVARWAERDFDCALLQARLYHALGQRATWQSALERVRALAGERAIPSALQTPPETHAS